MAAPLTPDLERAARTVAGLGHRDVELLGHGMEGAVFRLSAGRVAKVWMSRDVPELEQLQRFYADVAAAEPRVPTPYIESVTAFDGVAVTVERELLGTPLQRLLDPARPLDGADAAPVVDALVTCLESLRGIVATDAMRVLPVVGEAVPFRTHGSTFVQDLLALLRRRLAVAGPALTAVLPDLERRVELLVARLEELAPVAETVLHGDLFGQNILLDERGRPSAMLDFGFLATAGDPRFDAAVTAAITDMYGPHADRATTYLTGALAHRLGDDPAVLVVYRAAYAVATATVFGAGPEDGHFRWAAHQLAKAETAEAIGL